MNNFLARTGVGSTDTAASASTINRVNHSSLATAVGEGVVDYGVIVVVVSHDTMSAGVRDVLLKDISTASIN